MAQMPWELAQGMVHWRSSEPGARSVLLPPQGIYQLRERFSSSRVRTLGGVATFYDVIYERQLRVVTQPRHSKVCALQQQVVPGVAWQHGHRVDIWDVVGDPTHVEPEEALAVMDTLANPPLQNVTSTPEPVPLRARLTVALSTIVRGY